MFLPSRNSTGSKIADCCAARSGDHHGRSGAPRRASSQPVPQQNPCCQPVARVAAGADGRRRADLTDPRQRHRRARGLRPRTGPDRIRVELAKDLIADVRRFDEQLAANAAKITVLLEEHGTRLRKIDGIGPILAARLLGRTGPPNRSSRPRRMRTTRAPRLSKSRAPIPPAPASRYGDRQLNSAIYTIAMIQIRMPASTGRAYYDKKIAEGKTPRYATRALKRHLAGHLWRTMLADQPARQQLGSRDKHLLTNQRRQTPS